MPIIGLVKILQLVHSSKAFQMRKQEKGGLSLDSGKDNFSLLTLLASVCEEQLNTKPNSKAVERKNPVWELEQNFLNSFPYNYLLYFKDCS